MAIENIWEKKLGGEEDLESGDYPVLPEGTYDFEVASCEGKAHEAKPGGKIGYCAEIDLRMVVKHEGRQISVFDRLYSDPKTAWRMRQFARCIGITEDEISPSDVLREGRDGAGRFYVGIREYNGRQQNEVKTYYAQEQKEDPAPAPAKTTVKRSRKAPEAPVSQDPDDLPF